MSATYEAVPEGVATTEPEVGDWEYGDDGERLYEEGVRGYQVDWSWAVILDRLVSDALACSRALRRSIKDDKCGKQLEPS